MPAIPRRSLQSLAAEALVERRVPVFLVEGPSDRAILGSSVSRLGLRASFYCAEQIDIVADEGSNIENGNKGRLLDAISKPPLLELAGTSIFAIVDDDGDQFIGQRHPVGTISPSGSSLTAEIISAVGMVPFVEVVTGRTVRDQVINECIRLERRMNTIKLALKERDIHIENFSCRSIVPNLSKDLINVDYVEEHLRRCVKDEETAAAIITRANVLDGEIADDLSAVNFHRLFELLDRRLRSSGCTSRSVTFDDWALGQRATAQLLTLDNSKLLSEIAQITDACDRGA